MKRIDESKLNEALSSLQAAIALHDQRLAELRGASVRETASLLDLFLAGSDYALESFPREIVGVAVEIIDAEEGSLLRLDPNTEELEFLHVLGPSADKLQGVRISMHQGITGLAASTGATQCAAPTNPSVDEETGFVTREILAAPMMVNDRVVGVLTAVNKKNEGRFSLRDIEVYTQFAGLCGSFLRHKEDENFIRRFCEALRDNADADVGEVLAELEALASDSTQMKAKRITAMIHEIAIRKPYVLGELEAIVKAFKDACQGDYS